MENSDKVMRMFQCVIERGFVRPPKAVILLIAHQFDPRVTDTLNFCLRGSFRSVGATIIDDDNFGKVTPRGRIQLPQHAHDLPFAIIRRYEQ